MNNKNTFDDARRIDYEYEAERAKMSIYERKIYIDARMDGLSRGQAWREVKLFGKNQLSPTLRVE